VWRLWDALVYSERMLPLIALLAGCSTSKDVECVYPCDTSPPERDSDPLPDWWVDEDDSADSADSADSQETAPQESDEPEDTAPLVEEESLEGTPDPSAWLFDEDSVHVIDLTLTAGDRAALNADPYTYVQGDIEIDGMKVSDVGIRLKGKIGSFRTLAQKAAFKIDFNAYDPEQTFYGLKKLNLNNMVVDCSMLREHLAYKVFRDMGLAAERTGYAWVTVNGDVYGLYNILEQPNHELLERWYDDPSGNLYDGKYLYYGGSSYTLLDFTLALYDSFPLEEGVDVDNQDIYDIADAAATYGGAGDFYDELDPYIDWDRLLRYWAVEEWVGQNDGYALNRNNYFVYFDAADGKMEMIPWDMDYSFLTPESWGFSWSRPTGTLASYCMRDSACKAAWKEAAREVLTELDTDAYTADLETWGRLIQDYVGDDSRKECNSGSVGSAQAAMRDWVAGESDIMQEFWGL